MGITVAKILHCVCEQHDPKTPRAFEYIYETGVDPPHTYMCMACRQRILAQGAKFAEAREGNLPGNMSRTAEGRPLESRGMVGVRAPWQSVPKQMGAEEPADIGGAVTRKWGAEDDILVVNKEGRA